MLAKGGSAMKFLYKIFIIAIFVMAILFSGYARAGQSSVREQIKNSAVASLRDLAQRTQNKDTEQILQILEKQSITVVPTKNGFKEPVFQKKDGTVKIVVLIPTDAQYPFWYPILTNNAGFAWFFPAHDAIILKRDSNFHSLFRGIALDHEGWHARYFLKNPGNGDASDIQFSMEERDDYEHGNALLSIVGGVPYKIFLEKEMERMAPSVTKTNAEMHFPSPPEIYNEELEKIFGPAKSQSEKNFRISFVWVDTVFHYIDAHHGGTQAEKEIAKAQALLEGYRKIGVR